MYATFYGRHVAKLSYFRFVSDIFFEPFYMIFEPFPIRIKPLLSRLMAVLYSFLGCFVSVPFFEPFIVKTDN